MKAEVIKLLKANGKFELFTQERYDKTNATMNYSMRKDEWLKMYLGLDPLNKAQWIADHLPKFVEAGLI